MRDLRDAIRQWARTPVTTIVVVLSLALGIGANTAISSLIDSLLLTPLPVRGLEQLVRVVDSSFVTHGIPIWQQIKDQGIFVSAAAMSLVAARHFQQPRETQRLRSRGQRQFLRDARRASRDWPVADA